MTVTVLLFASYADTLGMHSFSLDVSAGTTVRNIVEHVRALPGAERLPSQPMVAVNERYAKPDRLLVGGDEVAIIPPVAGG